MANQFIVSDPDIDFVLRDGGPNQSFDGTADELFPDFGNIILGIDRDAPFPGWGEERSISEFDISTVPASLEGSITQATLEVQVNSLQTGRLGQELNTVPTSISVYGYVGNGSAEASDFQAGTLLNTIDLTDVAINDVLTFDITTFLDNLIADNSSFAGFAVRANNLGGITIQELDAFPQLRIQTNEASNPLVLPNPEVSFQVLDGSFGGNFDGLGDMVFGFETLGSSPFNGVILGAPRELLPMLGEERSIVEFDIADFTIPDGEEITEARLEVQVSDTQLSGLGQDGTTTPAQLSLYGYVGNGIAELSDFNRGSLIESIDSSSVVVGETLSFDVTRLVREVTDIRDLLNDDSATVGLGLRADTVGGIGLGESSALGVPRLVIETSDTISGGDVVTVDLLLDEEDGNVTPGDISLREALQIVNPGGTINFAPGLASQDAGFGQGVLGLTLGELVIDRSVTIEGLGSELLTLQQASSGSARVVLVDDGDANTQADVEINGITITGGALSNGGGSGIFNRETLTVQESKITGNTLFRTGIPGGGILNTGTLTLRRSTLSDNTGGPGGGMANLGVASVVNSSIINNFVSSAYENGIANGGGIENRGFLQITQSTITDNDAFTRRGSGGYGGGINNTGTLRITNSTISDNFSASGGGGINNEGIAEISNSSIVFNVRDTYDGFRKTGGGILSQSRATTTVVNSIVAGNLEKSRPRNGQTVAPDIAGNLAATSGFNLVGDGTGSNLQDGVNGNQVGTANALLDPKLGPLQDNGGPTLTHALLEDSPAVNAGSNALIPNGTTTDQRGEARIVGGTVDIGAYESDVADPVEPNTEPTVENPILDQIAQVAQSYRFELPDDVFDDGDGDVLTTSASLENGQPLPSWLSFDGTTETLQGTPQAADVGTVAIAITATDDDGNQATDLFDLTIEAPEPPDPTINKINGDDGNNRLDGTAVADLIRGFGGKDRLRGFDGNDELFGDAGNDTLEGNAGNDKAFGGVGKDRISGGLGDDELFGEDGGDRISGNDGNDTLSGGDGNDSLKGDNGDDILEGGAGRNQLRGGQGSDGFVLEVGSGFSQVKDFQLGEDHILLPKGVVFGDLTITQAKRKTQVLLGDDLALEVFGVNASDLDAGNFKYL